MRVLSTTASVEQGGPTWSTTFTALRDIEYKVEMRPSDSLLLSAMQVIAPHSHHVMASRFDATTHSSGVKVPSYPALPSRRTAIQRQRQSLLALTQLN